MLAIQTGSSRMVSLQLNTPNQIQKAQKEMTLMKKCKKKTHL
jgi:hypothetical protein